MAAKQKYTLTHYKVRGHFSFPLDMLRYDSSFPASESETGLIASTLPLIGGTHITKPVEIELITTHHPNLGRWDSFGWAVTEIDGVRLP